MADAYRKISDFSKTAAFNDTDLLLVSQNGSTKVVEGNKVKSYATEAGKEAAKITKAEINADGNLVLTLADGTTSFDCGEVVGTSITGASIDSNYHLILTLSNGNTLDAGYCRGEQGESNADMLKSVYDPNNVIAGYSSGIAGYVENFNVKTSALIVSSNYITSTMYTSYQRLLVPTHTVLGSIDWSITKISGSFSTTGLTFTMGNYFNKADSNFANLVCAGWLQIGTSSYPCVLYFSNMHSDSPSIQVRRADNASIVIDEANVTLRATYTYLAAS